VAANAAQIYVDRSRRFIRQAHYELVKKGDRYQASEKASDAAAQAVKAIAADRGWRHDSHQLRREIIDLPSVEFGRPGLRALQSTADQRTIARFKAQTGEDGKTGGTAWLALVEQTLESLARNPQNR
jgi:HEPN domain-containing protein